MIAMQAEIEAKFLNVDHNEFREKLRSLGATLEQPMRLMRRKNFDYPDGRLREIGGWVRVRDEGDKVTLAYKQLDHRGVDGTKEVSLEVADFDQACLFLERVGLGQSHIRKQSVKAGSLMERKLNSMNGLG